MRVTLQIEVDALDADDNVVGTIATTSALEDDLAVHPADIIKVYDDDRHKILTKLAEREHHPRWDYRPRSGKN